MSRYLPQHVGEAFCAPSASITAPSTRCQKQAAPVRAGVGMHCTVPLLQDTTLP